MTDMVLIIAESIYFIISMCHNILFGDGQKFTVLGKISDFSVAWSVANLNIFV